MKTSQFERPCGAPMATPASLAHGIARKGEWKRI